MFAFFCFVEKKHMNTENEVVQRPITLVQANFLK